MSTKMRGNVVKRGKTWSYVISVTDPGTGRRRQIWKGGFPKRQDAVDARHEAMVAANKGLLVVPRKQTLSEYLAGWLSDLNLKPKTIAGYRYNVDTYIAPALGATPLQSLRQEHIKSFYAEMAVRVGRRKQPLGPATRTSVHRTLRAALESARKAGLIATNPATAVTPQRATVTQTYRRGPGSYDAAELRKLLDVTSSHRLGALFVLAAHTGARRGELLFLRWSHVDMDAGSIDIVGSRTIVDKQAVEGSTKTGRSRRVSLGERAVAALREHHTAQLIERDRAGVAWQGPADGYVFVRADGRPIHPDTPSKLMKAFADKAGVPRLRFHDLRHTHATLLLSSGAPDYEVGHRLGHVNPTVTRNIYAHVLPQRADEMGTAFGKLLAGS